MRTLGITTTIPIEVTLAAGCRVLDLNNVFVTSGQTAELIERAETIGFPKSMCAWIKGLYGATFHKEIDEIVGVIEGDCSNTKVLTEILSRKGIAIRPFAFPHSQKYEDVRREIEKFMDGFGVTLEQVEKVRQDLFVIRELAAEIDHLTWFDNKVSGFENHLHLVSCSDFDGDATLFEATLKAFIQTARQREPMNQVVRLAYIGVPPMTGDLYDFVELQGARVVFNEVQREFSFPRATGNKDIFEQYTQFTYPYGLEGRIDEIKKQIELREIHGVLHYSQAFCHRAAEDIIFNEVLGVPVLNIEGDRDTQLDARTKLRLEAFIDMLTDTVKGITI